MLGVVCGMQSEVRALGAWARNPRVRVAVSGARPDRAEAEARRLVAEGCGLLVSWGVAGGLDPALKPGDLVIPRGIVDEAGAAFSLECTLVTRLGEAIWTDRTTGLDGTHLGLDCMVLSATEKAALRSRTGAAAVDMESHRIARVAAEAGIPAVAIRAVGDPAGRDLPRLVADALDAEGRPRVAAVALGLLRSPGALGPLLALRRDTEAALATLSGVADRSLRVLAEAG